MFLSFKNWSVETSLTPILRHLITFYTLHSFSLAQQEFQTEESFEDCEVIQLIQ